MEEKKDDLITFYDAQKKTGLRIAFSTESDIYDWRDILEIILIAKGMHIETIRQILKEKE